jgi:hypothetical protein
LKIFYKINDTAENHSKNSNLLISLFEKQYGIKADPQVKDIARLCFISSDPNLYLNQNSKPLDFTNHSVFHKIEFSATAKKLWIAALLVIIIAFLPLSLMISSSKLLPAMILLLLIGIFIHYIQFRKQKSFFLAILGFILMFVAVNIRTLDVQKNNCDPHSFYQGHSVWHLLTAMSSFCSYAFFRFSKIQIYKKN